MDFWQTALVAIITGIFGSGVFSLIVYLIQRHDKKKEKKEDRNLADMRNDLYILYSICKEKGFREIFDTERFNDTFELYKSYGGNSWAEVLKGYFDNIPEKK